MYIFLPMSKLSGYLRAIYHHEEYHGWFKRRRFFEGWYFKIVDKTQQHAFAFIPGIAMDDRGNRQAFIQVLDGIHVTADYYKFDREFFHPNDRRFKVKIKENSFSMNRIKLQLPEIRGQVHFSEHVKLPKTLLWPGIMGWYSYVPLMECYHQVISMDTELTGKLVVRGQEIDFTGGRGYIEKDWGRSFPSSWIWMQSNHFANPKTSFKLSVAKIPWLNSSFVGFISVFLLNGKILRFATYTGAKLKEVAINENGTEVCLEDKRYILRVNAVKAAGAELKSPIQGLMEGKVKESMQAVMHITLFDKHENRLIFNDTGNNTGLEIAGDTHELLQF